MSLELKTIIQKLEKNQATCTMRNNYKIRNYSLPLNSENSVLPDNLKPAFLRSDAWL